ncbi:MAG: hypothetical protein NTW86_12815, partial [Candidatus Sumerlaeota bacterium]|nr:hypothetical protein [Candidatus Sumerlaeota bacterium]
MASRSRRWGINLAHAALLALLMTGLGAAVSARATFFAVRRSLSDRFRLTVTLETKLAESEVKRALEALGALPGVAVARLRDREKDETALFADEPWAKEYRDALGGHFLPPLAEVALVDPYGSRKALNQIVGEARKIAGVTTVAFHRPSYEQTAEALANGRRLLGALVFAAVILVFLGSIPAEALREGSEDSAALAMQARREDSNWAARRLALGLAATA